VTGRRTSSKDIESVLQEQRRFAPDGLPKTRSGKIMRRLLRAIARREEISQDISTLENPAIVAQRRSAAVRKRARPAAPVKSKGRAKRRTGRRAR